MLNEIKLKIKRLNYSGGDVFMLYLKKRLICITAIFLVFNLITGNIFINSAGAEGASAAKPNFNVVFIGGSITEGAGASSVGNCYVSKVGEYLKQMYPDKQVNIFNAGVGGTGSDYGIFRLQQDVISHDPDLVFVEFAVNDIGMVNTPDLVKINMEGIVRLLLKLPKPPIINFIYATRNDFAACTDLHNQVAKYYGIPTYDLQTYIKSLMNSGKTKPESFWVDGVHPNDYGYGVYADFIIDKLKNKKDSYLKPAVMKEKPLTGYEWDGPRFASYTEANYVGDWTDDVLNNRPYKYTESDDAYVEYKFYGKSIGIENLFGNTSSDGKYMIDGKNADTFTMYLDYIGPRVGANFKTIELTEGWHTIKIMRLANKNVDGGGKLGIFSFMLDDGNKPSDGTETTAPSATPAATATPAPVPATATPAPTVAPKPANDDTAALKEKLDQAIALFIGSSKAYVNNNVKSVDDSNQDVVPVVKDGRTLVPVRFISENFGAKVDWDEAQGMVTVNKDDKVIKMSIGSTQYTVDGKEQTLEVPAQTINERTFIPLRALVEALGKNVFWDDRGLIMISDSDKLFDKDSDKKLIDEAIELF